MARTVSAPRQRQGTFANGMEYLTLGDGAKSLLFIQGGPGSALLSEGARLRLLKRMVGPYVEAGYTVSQVTRRRHMPAGHTVEDMARDYADVIRDEFGGRVDVVVGLSYGGMIAQYLAALHPERVGAVVLVAAGCVVSEKGVEIDRRFAAARADRKPKEAGAVLAESVVPGPRWRWLRRLIGLRVAPLMGGDFPREDVITEIEAEAAFDSREVLPRVSVPVLIITGDRDPFFPEAVMKETASLIPDHAVVWYRGKGHIGVGSSREVPRDVLRFLS